MKTTVDNPADIFRITCSHEKVREYFKKISQDIDSCGNVPLVRYVSLGSTDVRLNIMDPAFLPILQTYLGFSLKEESVSCDYSIVLWRTSGHIAGSEKLYHIVERDADPAIPSLIFYKGGVSGFDKDSNVYYCGYPDCTFERLTLVTGVVLLSPFYKILKKASGALVHGACVGLDGKGVILCARGGKGKSTLAVSALIKGFEFVADDYFILDSKSGDLYASPLYSIVKLSYQMYSVMQEGLAESVIVSDNPQNGKYMIDVSHWHGQFRNNYPVKVCMLPEIVPGLETPSIIRCSEEEKGKGIIRMVHSTISQLFDVYDTSGSLKLIRMLQNQTFYRIRLCPDIYKNVECLRSFLQELKN